MEEELERFCNVLQSLKCLDSFATLIARKATQVMDLSAGRIAQLAKSTVEALSALTQLISAPISFNQLLLMLSLVL